MLVDEVTTYLHGFPIGYVDSDSNANLFNHITIVIKIHKFEENAHRIVGFEIKVSGIIKNCCYIEFCCNSYTVCGKRAVRRRR